MTTSPMNTGLSPDQARNMLILDGWVPIIDGGARHPTKLYVIDAGDDSWWKGSPTGEYARGLSDAEDWDMDKIVALYETIERLGCI